MIEKVMMSEETAKEHDFFPEKILPTTKCKKSVNHKDLLVVVNVVVGAIGKQESTIRGPSYENLRRIESLLNQRKKSDLPSESVLLNSSILWSVHLSLCLDKRNLSRLAQT